jgi:tryptophan synthase alpha chain
MSRISDAFANARAQDRGALVVYITAGDPNLGVTRELVPLIARAGADVIELGMPYSDPVADGPTIQAAGQRALAAGATVDGILAMVRTIRSRCDVPLVFMTCYNPVLQHGLETFAAEAAAAGIDGVLISDLPPEEAGPWCEIAWAAGLDTIFLASPTTPPARARLIADLARGFVYAVARAGVTGAQAELPPDLPELIGRLREVTDKPIAVGFGISTPAQVRQVCEVADGAIVGSAVVKLIEEMGGAEDIFYTAPNFVSSLAAATRRA